MPTELNFSFKCDNSICDLIRQNENGTLGGHESTFSGTKVCGWQMLLARIWLPGSLYFPRFFSRHYWVADLLANLRVQLVIVGLSVLLAGFFLRQWRLALLSCVVLAVHLPWFLSALPPVPQRERVGHGITMTSINVLSGNIQYDRVIADLINANTDVIAVLELTPTLDQKLRQDLPDFRHVITRSKDEGNFGVGVYSKHPLADSELFESVQGIESIAVTVVVEQRQAPSE